MKKLLSPLAGLLVAIFLGASALADDSTAPAPSVATDTDSGTSILPDPTPAPAPLPSCDVLSKLWKQTYTKDFQISWANGSFDCDGSESLLAVAFYDLQQFKFPSTLKVPPHFYATVARRLREIVYDDTCTYLAMTLDHTITICKPFFDDSRADRASTLVHESRHTDENDPGHVTCNRGQYVGNEGACDEDFYNGAWAGSGYNGDAYFYGNAIHQALPNALTRDELQSNLNGILPERFNHITAQQINAWR